jgi:hypothetical protein
MAFFSDMVRPDQHEEREEDANLPTAPTSSQDHTPEEERAIIERLEQYFGRKPTQQKIKLALDQARSFQALLRSRYRDPAFLALVPGAT